MDSHLDTAKYAARLVDRAESAGPRPLVETGQEQAAGAPLESLKRLLRRLRVEQGLSAGGLARRARLGRTTTSQALNGATVPSEATLVSLAQALRTPPDPLLELRALACTAGNTPADPVPEFSEHTAQPPEQAREQISRLPGGPETRFTYEYLEQRPTNLLRVLHGKLRDYPLVGLRIRVVDIHRAVQLDDPGLPGLMVQCAEECLAYKDQIKGRPDGNEVMFILIYLVFVFENRFRYNAASAVSSEVYNVLSSEVYSTAIYFLAEFDIDSSVFLHLRSILDIRTDGGVNAPWPFLDDVVWEVGPCYLDDL